MSKEGRGVLAMLGTLIALAGVAMLMSEPEGIQTCFGAFFCLGGLAVIALAFKG